MRFNTTVDRDVDTAGDGGGRMSRGGRGLQNNDNLIRPQYKNCYQMAEDKNEKKKIKGGASIP